MLHRRRAYQPHHLTPTAHHVQAAYGARKVASRATKLKQNWELYGADNTQGLIYFIQGSTGGPIKIGCTEWLVRRFYSLQNGNPDELLVLGAFPVDLDQLRVIERGLHKRFDYARVRGEWFRPVEPLVELATSDPGQIQSPLCGNLNCVDEQPPMPSEAQ